MDKKDRKILLEALGLLRMLEKNKKKYVSDTIICSSALVQCVATVVEDFGKTFVLFEIDHVPKRFDVGEVIQFNMKHVIKLLLWATNTAGAAKERQIFVPSSCDTTRTTTGFGFVMRGLKSTDRGGCCPLTHGPLILQVEEGQKAQSLVVQSYKNCIPTSLVLLAKRPKILFVGPSRTTSKSLKKRTSSPRMTLPPSLVKASSLCNTLGMQTRKCSGLELVPAVQPRL
jgi:hypothetical protein